MGEGREGDLLDTLADFLATWRFEAGSRTMTMRISGGQSTSGENRPGDTGAEKGSQGTSAETTSSEKKWTREYSPPKSISAKRKNPTIDGPRKRQH